MPPAIMIAMIGLPDMPVLGLQIAGLIGGRIGGCQDLIGRLPGMIVGIIIVCTEINQSGSAIEAPMPL